MNKYKIQSIIISPSPWTFRRTTALSLSDELSFSVLAVSGQEGRHIVSYECEAENINEAWKKFFEMVEEFVEATAFHTSSYLSFQDWNNIVINQTKKCAILSIYLRTLGTPLSLYSQECVNDVNIIINNAKLDIRLKNFLHCYKMAILLDASETQDAYEKYLLFACESLAGEVDGENGYKKVDTNRLKLIIGKGLHRYFFSSVNPTVGKTIRNANMHNGKSPNDKPSKTLKLVKKLREFITKEYGLNELHIIEEVHSPTRGLYRDDVQRLFVSGEGVCDILLENISNLSDYIKDIPSDIKILSGKEAAELFKLM